MPFAQLSSVRLHYFERGDRASASETVVFVHGFQASGRVWGLMQELLPESYYSIAINNRGAGESEAPANEAAYGCKPFADDVFELITQLGLRDFTLVGHSMGGATVMQFAVDHPDAIKALVLMDPAGPNGRELSGDALERLIDERIAARKAQLAAGHVRKGIISGAADARTEFARALEADIRAAPEVRLRGSMRSMMSIRIGDRLCSLPMPVLLVGGDADQLVPLRNMLDTHALLPPGSGLQIWHGAGHSPNTEIPEEATAVLRRFIEQTVPAWAGREVVATR